MSGRWKKHGQQNNAQVEQLNKQYTEKIAHLLRNDWTLKTGRPNIHNLIFYELFNVVLSLSAELWSGVSYPLELEGGNLLPHSKVTK